MEDDEFDVLERENAELRARLAEPGVSPEPVVSAADRLVAEAAYLVGGVDRRTIEDARRYVAGREAERARAARVDAVRREMASQVAEVLRDGGDLAALEDEFRRRTA